MIVEDLDVLKDRLERLLSDPKPAVQPGRRIATLSRNVGLGQAVAFMTPEAQHRGVPPAAGTRCAEAE